MHLIQIFKKNITLKIVSSNFTKSNPDKAVIGKGWTDGLGGFAILNDSVIL